MTNENDKYIKGIIDIGTNSCRLFIAEIMKTKEEINILNELVKEVEIVKLGEEVNKNHFLKEEAIERTIECLKKYKETADKYEVKELKAFATSATRDADNREEFLKKVRDLGIEIECISGEEEAKLNFLGNSLVFDERILVIDIGGGSTEFTLGKNNEIDFIKSIDIGAVRATEKFFSRDDYSKENIEKCKEWIKKNIEEIKKIRDEEFKVVGVAGTATTQISVKKEMKIYNSQQVHMSEISVKELEENLKLFISKNIEEREEIIGLEPKRADVIIAGTIILITILKELNRDKIVISESDNLTGAMIKEEENE
ncbi:Ppx/GppA phosphatase family protein [Fusobacterium sp.]|uniref:Ppx/GppA phosphatase family protein n=1 Tax=Fusobacterium sp. TaxID=68766 RepID=UPI0029014114|nr:Ppx/GppA phosphatase family protein [Fusobacterium sp.]MDU1909910.1 Ppx/GppA phosphatase family protein [Fusobacterium sp.]